MKQVIMNKLYLCLFELLLPVVEWLQKMIEAPSAGGRVDEISEIKPVVLVRVFINTRAVLLALPLRRQIESISLQLQDPEISMKMEAFSTDLRRYVDSGLWSPRPMSQAETVILRRSYGDLYRQEVEDGLILPDFQGPVKYSDYLTELYRYAA